MVCLSVPWDGRSVNYNILLLHGSNDSVGLAPRVLFAHLPHSPSNAVTHLTAARGFKAKAIRTPNPLLYESMPT